MMAAVKNVKSALLGAAIFSGLCNILMLSGSIYMLQVYDRVLSSRSIPTLVGLTFLVLLLYIFLGIFEAIRNRIMARVGDKVEEEVAPKVFDLITTMPLHMAQRNEGLLPLRDFDTVKNFIGGSAFLTLFDLPWVPFYIIVCFLFHPWVGVASLVGVLILILLTVIIEISTKSKMKAISEVQSERMLQMENARKNAEVLRAMGMTPQLRKIFLKNSDKGLETQRSAMDLSTTMSNIAKISRMVLQSLVLAVGAVLVVKGEATGGVMIACSVLSARALAPIDQAIAQWKGFTQARESHARLVKLLGAMPQEGEKLNLPAPHKSIEVRGVSVIPPGAKIVSVADATLQLNAGEGLAIIGPSASGKSSLARAIVNIWGVARGEIRIDGASFQQWDADKLGQYIGYLPQDVSLFAGTIAQNIARFEEELSSDKIMQAAKLARVHDMIMSFQKGYDTELGEGGTGLSQGQRQRIALARAIYKNPFLVVLDEPNANLDVEGENALTECILDLRKMGSIVIVVAHRPSAVVALNLVAIVQKGKIMKFGPKEKILGTKQAGAAAPPAPPQPPKPVTIYNNNTSLQ